MSADILLLSLDRVEGRALHDAISLAVSLMDQVEAEPGNSIPKHAPLYGQRERLVRIARRLDHEMNCAARESEDTTR